MILSTIMRSNIIARKNIVIGVCGVKTSGKDTISDMFVKEGDLFTKLQISESLKNICKQLFHFDESQVNSIEKDIVDERYKTTPRKILQFFGTDIMQYEIQKIIGCNKDLCTNIMHFEKSIKIILKSLR